ncbi:MAG: cupin domain-containing protein [Candidatus Bathyarchaeia archaeon]
MRVFSHKDVPLQVAEEGAQGVKVRWLITSETGAPNFYMRLFEVSPGGSTPFHSHPWEHEVFVLEGRGLAQGPISTHPIQEGDVIFTSPGEEHQFRNNGEQPLRFLCLIPSEKFRGK